MKKFKRYKISDPIFHAIIYVQLGGEAQKAVDWFADEINQERMEVTNRSAGKFFENSVHHGGCIWVENTKSKLFLIHEALHATHYILRRLRIELNCQNRLKRCFVIIKNGCLEKSLEKPDLNCKGK